ncbi:hypothetical protein ACIHCQ_31545 [Streptomyces sp. NPDC052236]|uniref:hypothetical protein n=1 Tax=Streptomyces sp. NPDC052236 TaxID=3365686 RepID=UPI0037D8AE48
MISHGDDSRHELFLREGLDAVDVVRAHTAALRVLRSSIESAHVDAYSDVAWPQDVMPSYEQALCLARNAVVSGTRSARADPGMGIDIDIRDDAQFEVLLALAPYTIHAEGWLGNQSIFSMDDTGTALWVAVTAAEEVELRSQLDTLGIARMAFTAECPGGGRTARARQGGRIRLTRARRRSPVERRPAQS